MRAANCHATSPRTTWETSCASTARSGKSPQLRQCIGKNTQGRCQPTHKGTGVNRLCLSSSGRRQPRRRQTSAASALAAGSSITWARLTILRAARMARADFQIPQAAGTISTKNQNVFASIRDKRGVCGTVAVTTVGLDKAGVEFEAALLPTAGGAVADI